MADFGVLHRNELSGALTGLTRVRRFQQVRRLFCEFSVIFNDFVLSVLTIFLCLRFRQDDAHIFCRENQVSFIWIDHTCLLSSRMNYIILYSVIVNCSIIYIKVYDVMIIAFAC